MAASYGRNVLIGSDNKVLEWDAVSETVTDLAQHEGAIHLVCPFNVFAS